MVEDHGEQGVLERLHQHFVTENLGAPYLTDAAGKPAKNCIFYCHFHKLINFLEEAAKGMGLAEGTPEKPTAEILALDVEFEGRMSGIFCVAAGFRRVGKPSAYSVIYDMAKVVGTKIGANETMWKGEEVNILKRISTQPILKSDGWSWDSHRNARGDQSYFSNAGLALVMLLTAGLGGIVHLIQGLIGKAGHSNHLYDCILAVSNNINVIAQMAIMCVFHHCVFSSYREYASSLNQWDCIAIDIELVRVMEDLAANACSINELPYREGHADDFLLCSYKAHKGISDRVRRLLTYLIRPPTHANTQLEAFYKATKLYIPAFAAGVLAKCRNLFAEKYGNLLNRPASDQARMVRIDGSSIAVERVFGVLDQYIRDNNTMSKLRCCLYLLIIKNGANLAHVLDDKHITLFTLESLFRAAWTFAKRELYLPAQRRAEADAKFTQVFMCAKAADMERKKIKKDEKIEMLQGLGEEDFDESEVETHRQLAKTRGTQKSSKDWLGTRCVCP